jgi:hypothetical protein
MLTAPLRKWKFQTEEYGQEVIHSTFDRRASWSFRGKSARMNGQWMRVYRSVYGVLFWLGCFVSVVRPGVWRAWRHCGTVSLSVISTGRHRSSFSSEQTAFFQFSLLSDGASFHCSVERLQVGSSLLCFKTGLFFSCSLLSSSNLLWGLFHCCLLLVLHFWCWNSW